MHDVEYGMAGIENQIKSRQNLEFIQTGQTNKIDKYQQYQHNPLCMMGNFACLIFQNYSLKKILLRILSECSPNLIQIRHALLYIACIAS